MPRTPYDPTTRRLLQPATPLWKRYAPASAPYAFRARTAAEAARWQRRTRAALAEALGFQDAPPVPLRPRRIEQVDKGDYVRQKWLLRTTAHSVMPVYLLLPKAAKVRPPVVLALHGHGYGVKDIVGLWEDGSERDVPDGYHKDFAVALCRRGFAVAAPEIACFGERQTDFSYLDATLGQPVPTSCHHAATLAFHLGLSVLGLRVWEARRLVDWLATRRDLDASRLGAMGISGGGMYTLYSAAVDTRIRAAVISGYFCTYRDSILAMHHCPCNYVPGAARFGEMADVLGLVAPRAVLVEAGTRDPIFPLAAVRKGLARARAIYRAFDPAAGAGNVRLDCFEGRHQISGRLAYDFLWERLS